MLPIQITPGLVPTPVADVVTDPASAAQGRVPYVKLASGQPGDLNWALVTPDNRLAAADAEVGGQAALTNRLLTKLIRGLELYLGNSFPDDPD